MSIDPHTDRDRLHDDLAAFALGLTALIGSRATRPLAAAAAVLATLSTVTIAIALISPPEDKTLREART